jgi:predicted RecB family nuclease
MESAPVALDDVLYVAGLQCPLRLWQRAQAGAPADAEEALAARAREALLRAVEVGLERTAGAVTQRAASPQDVRGRSVARQRDASPDRDAPSAGPLERVRAWLRANGDDTAAAAGTVLPAQARCTALRVPARALGAAVVVDMLEVRHTSGRATLTLRGFATGRAITEAELDRLALQCAVLTALGLAPARIEAGHVDTNLRRGAVPLPHHDLILLEDVTEHVRFLAEDVPDQLAALARHAQARPAVEPSPHCRTPSRCPYIPRCFAPLPADALVHLPGLSAAQHYALVEAGVRSIAAIPEGTALTAPQSRARAAHRAGGLVVAPELRERLRGAGLPALYLDFECASSPVPALPETAPLEPIPYQWSLHWCTADGATGHAEHLAEPGEDPRRSVTTSLLAAVAEHAGPVLVYSDFEARRLTDLATALPDLRTPLEALRARLVDLLPVVRETAYTPALGGSFSLKHVGPALCRAAEPPYAASAIQNGAQAALALADWSEGGLTATRREALRSALLTYCASDTRALLETHLALLRAAATA